MRTLLLFSFFFLLICIKDAKLKNNMVKKSAIFLFLFFYIATVRIKTYAATWSVSKEVATFTVSSDEIVFEQDDNNYYFAFDLSNNPYGYASSTSFVVSQRSDIGYIYHTVTYGTDGSYNSSEYSKVGSSGSLGTFALEELTGNVIKLRAYPYMYVYDTSIGSGHAVSNTGVLQNDVCVKTIQDENGNNVYRLQIPKSKINLFRYINFRGTKNHSGHPTVNTVCALSHAFDLTTLTDHECDFKIRFLDNVHHDYYCNICHWSKNKTAHVYEYEDIFGYSNRRCECGAHNKSTVRLYQESSSDAGGSSSHKISHIDIIGSPLESFTSPSMEEIEIEGYVFLGFDPPLPDVFPNESVEYKLKYRPITYKVLYSFDNFSKLSNEFLESSMVSKGTARRLNALEISEIENEYGISLYGLTYSLIEDCIYDKDIYMPKYKMKFYGLIGWGSIKNNFSYIYSAGRAYRNLTTKDNDVIVLNPLFEHYSDDDSDNDITGDDSVGKREDGDSGIIHHGDNDGGPGSSGSSDGSGGNGSGGGGSGGGGGGGGGNNESKSSDISQGGSGSDGSGNTDAGDGGSSKIPNDGDGENNNLNNLNYYNYKDLDLLSIYELENLFNGLSEIDYPYTNMNLVYSNENQARNNLLHFLDSETFAQKFSDHLEDEKLYIENLRNEKLMALTKLILKRTYYFLLLLLLILFARDRLARQKAKKCIK